MPISDDIVFRHRLERRPEFADGETERAQKQNEKQILHICRIATARMLDRLRQKLAEKKQAERALKADGRLMPELRAK